MTKQLTDLTPEQVARKALELAEASPEFTYTPPAVEPDGEHIFRDEHGTLVDDEGYEIDDTDAECQYTQRDKDGNLIGSCLYGQAFAALGVDLTSILQYEGSAVQMIFDPEAGNFGHIEDPVLRAMKESQSAQDMGKPWGMAAEPLRKALEGDK